MLITIRSLKERRFAAPKGEEEPRRDEEKGGQKTLRARGGDGPGKERDEIRLTQEGRPPVISII